MLALQIDDPTMLEFLFRRGRKPAADAPPDTGVLDALIAEGNAREDGGDTTGALETYRQALSMAGGPYWRAYLNIGNALRRLDRLADAIEHYREAARLAPDQAGAHLNLGTALLRTGDLPAAASSFRAAIDLRPAWPEAWFGLARALESSSCDEQAIDAYRTVLREAAGHAAAAAGLARLLMRSGRGREAREVLERTLTGEGRPEQVLSAYAEILRQSGEAERALDYCREASMQAPGDLAIFSDYLFTLNLVDDIDAGLVLDEHRRYGRLIGNSTQRLPSRDPRADVDRLRVGYVSPDFRRHPIACFIQPVLGNHDQRKVEVFCYHNHVDRDEVTERIQSYAEHWRDVAGITDEGLAELIASDGIDVLVDLAGHTSGGRLPVFARKPAPVQITWLGYLCTTGVDAIDFRICDAHTDPPGIGEGQQVETPLRMPHAQWCYRPQVAIPAPSKLPMLDNGYCTFGSFNQASKLNEHVIETWTHLLSELPHSRLRILGITDDIQRASIIQAFEHAGVAASRIDVLKRVSIEEYFECYRSVDVALDTFPYNGATTTCDALIMGVPVATVEGERAISRGCASLLATLGLHEWIVASRDLLLPMVRRLIEEPPHLATLRETLPERMRASPLMDAERFVTDLEHAYLTAWRSRA